MSGDIQPYQIHVSDESINLLKQKLALATFPDGASRFIHDAPTADADTQ